jgi:hypothetical protein
MPDITEVANGAYAYATKQASSQQQQAMRMNVSALCRLWVCTGPAQTAMVVTELCTPTQSNNGCGLACTSCVHKQVNPMVPQESLSSAGNSPTNYISSLFHQLHSCTLQCLLRNTIKALSKHCHHHSMEDGIEDRTFQQKVSMSKGEA